MHAAIATELDRSGLLLVQGQAEVPSLADLLAGQPVTTRGYSWDYVPAWQLAWDLDQTEDCAEIKLWRGRRTIVAQRLWPAVEALARASRTALLAPGAPSELRNFLQLIEQNPGITGAELKAALGLNAREFQQRKGKLDCALTILGEHQDEASSHTHDLEWRPWATGKIGTALQTRELPSIEEAIAELLAAAQVASATPRQVKILLPVVAYTG